MTTATKSKVTEGYAIQHIKTKRWLVAGAVPDMRIEFKSGNPLLFRSSDEVKSILMKVVHNQRAQLEHYKSLPRTEYNNKCLRAEIMKLEEMYCDPSDYKIGKYKRVVTTEISFDEI